MNSFKSYEKTIILQLKESDQDSLTVLYSKYAKKVFSLAFYILKDQAWSEDVVQEVFIHLWTTREDIDENKDIWLLLYIITKQKALTKLRSIMRYEVHKQYHWSLVNEKCEPVEEEIALRELKENLDKALNKLTPTQKQIFNLSRFDGLTHYEIASKLSISPNTVKNHMVAAMKSLRLYLQENEFLGIIIFIGFEFILDLI
ncbi:RNA polymerase sigma factor [Sphingobacterium yanglingense]|uniref:RNA polymerase sigma-70 factor (ECF subfamily) n=1 Tax=Sphingobacterium yanglingense TaxID=1437280 RepID=A0A4R6WHY1_9SPHI|nr:RNA polymerase sigma-70 factor [Sphingobacterium yanglingense]TDQ79823.1 RNA polymerase sigma-70 factor (ECF subfamily) [Sphingobacterium yanglingense]